MNKSQLTSISALNVQPLNVTEQQNLKGGLLLFTCEEKRSRLTGRSYMVPVVKPTRGLSIKVQM